MMRRVIHASRVRGGGGHRTLVLSCGHTKIVELLSTRRAPAWAECRGCVEASTVITPPPESPVDAQE